MDLFLSFTVFLISMIFCLKGNYSSVYALLIGLVAFTWTSTRRGFSLKEILPMAKKGLKDAWVVILIIFIIGMITGIWRASGTIAFFVYYGIKLITPKLFLLIAFLLSALLSYAIGTSFGVAATVGVIFMTLAQTGAVDPVITAGVLMSGIYIGDRSSPASSSASLVANITGTDLFDNVRRMIKNAFVPFLITLLIYALLSVKNPIGTVDQSFLEKLETQFNIHLLTALPALLMLLLPLLKVPVRHAMEWSIATAMAVSYFIQDLPLRTVFTTLFTGYQSSGPLSHIMNGGGVISMVEVELIVAISSMYSGIFSGTRMLAGVQEKIQRLQQKIGFGAILLTSLMTLSVFCNQTIASILVHDLHRECYPHTPQGRIHNAMDLEDSVILLAGIVPWSISASVPLQFMGADARSIPYAFFLFLVPLWHYLKKIEA